MDKGPFFTPEAEAPADLRAVAEQVDAKHDGETSRRGRGRPKGSSNKPKPPVAETQSENVGVDPSYLDPEVVRIGVKAIVKAVDDYICSKFYNMVISVTNGDDALAQGFVREARVSEELVVGYGEAGVALVKKYGFLLQYAPEGMMLACIMADSSMKYATFKKIKELAKYVQKINHERHQAQVPPSPN